MPLERLTPSQLKGRPRGRANPQYVEFLTSLRAGEGGRATTKGEKATKQTIKNRLNTASKHLGLKVHYLRSPADEVVFWVEK